MKHLPNFQLSSVALLVYASLLSSLLLMVSCEKNQAVFEELIQGDAVDDQDGDSSDIMNDDDNDDDDDTNGGDQHTDCPDSIGFVFEESNGIVSIEFENNDFPDGWVLRNNASGISGDGYMQWEGSPSMGTPGNGKVTFPVRITTAGTYRFLWNSSFQLGDDGTEHNDSWLRFPDADDYFGRKSDGSVVYPNDTGKTPNPNGSSSDGWFKIYRSGNDNAFKWQALTSDHDGHDIFVTFSNAGVYLMEISARSDYHAIDRLLLFEENINSNDAIQAAATFSEKTVCN